ncbi:hypothetical protein [Desulfomonile tiedjei]|uniref:Uncharacterized protein n=1 Tax=Desulfomonile tiedjei (strain ATCC 49306 / DSM 6799 / DCB-1) TaxID=706587 RepID=I4C5S6_DESTA|nr:hypothetical protein [Desulfomonile tiedjei]AFM24917.1 hypothetical protein Desti_2226 [Desulfomonile tiedjei DSM 6799]
MPEYLQIALGLFGLAGVFVLTRYIVAYRIKRATGYIIRDLQKHRALDPVSAVELPYARHNPLRIGMRNYHAKAIEFMLSEGVVGKTTTEKYYLRLDGRGSLSNDEQVHD